MPARLTWIGERFGRIEVVSLSPNSRKVIGRCECGTVRSFTKVALRVGDVRSCGCLRREKLSKRSLRSWDQKLWGRLDKTADCWNWTGALNQGGYGICAGSNRKTLLVHRVAYEIAIGEIPKGKFVLHTCDNRRCCNPKHLWLGDNTENMLDMAAKGRGRSRPGEFSVNAKLTQDDARAIRSAYATGNFSQQELAEKYAVSQRVISLITRGKTYVENPNLPMTLTPPK